MRRLLQLCLIVNLQLLFNVVASAQPATQFSTLENKLRTASSLSFDFALTASGAIEVSIAGSLTKSASGAIELAATGEFAGQSIDLVAIGDDQRFEFGHRSNPVTQKPPVFLWDALVIGLTRMGVLHNIANLSAGLAPDHAEGGVADWVLATNMARQNDSFVFDIVVSGVPSGSATLTVDEQGNPQLREQTVEFPNGVMIVTERYSNFVVQ